MNNSPTKIVLLGLLLLLLVAPFAVFAPLVAMIFVSVLGLMGWTLIQTLFTGKANEGDRDPTANHSQR